MNRIFQHIFLAGMAGSLFVLFGCEQNTIKPDTTEVDTPTQQNPAAALTSSPEPITTVSLPVWHTGDRWLWSDGYGLEVSEINGNKTRFDRLDADDQWHLREDFFVIESQSRTRHRKVIYRTENPALIFPLKIGNQSVFRREYMSNDKLIIHRTSWMVEGKETITVPAGTFDCWILVKRTRSMESNWTGYERWWYSPEVKHYVRLEYRYGPVTDGTRTLMAYSLVPERDR